MILTVSLNPAIDNNCEVDTLNLGQVNRLKKSTAVAGGKGVNVTKVLNKFHMPVLAMGFLGGDSGKKIENTLIDLGIECSFTQTSAKTRINTNIITGDGRVTEILESGERITREEICTFMNQYEAMLMEARIVVLSGSLPQGVTSDFYGKLIERAHHNHCFVILDSSKEALRDALDRKPDCIKPNIAELRELTQKDLKRDDEIIQAAKELVAKGIKYVVVSMGEKGLCMVSEKGVIKAVPPSIEAVNTVGCGDCVVAALAMGFYEKLTMEEMVKSAVGISAANALTLENGDIPVKEVRGLVEKVKLSIE